MMTQSIQRRRIKRTRLSATVGTRALLAGSLFAVLTNSAVHAPTTTKGASPWAVQPFGLSPIQAWPTRTGYFAVRH
jgi:hypothetical protein